MCGIVGFTGTRPAQGILIEGLSRLEYRGYDSAGVAIYQDGKLEVVHRKGKVSSLAHTLGHFDFEGTCGIGHTRWATHGRPSEANAHPHTSCDGRIAVVHNGIIENFADLREELQAVGHSFTSDTDTEVVPHLIEQALRDGAPDLLSAVRAASERLVGAYALAVVSADEPGAIVATRKDSPLVVGQGAEGAYVASDIIAMIDATRDVVVMNDGELAKLTPEGVTYYTAAGQVIENPKVTHVDWNLDVAEKGGYPDFMLKEIHEQPEAVKKSVSSRIDKDGLPDFSADGIDADFWRGIRAVQIVACGSAMHAGLVGQRVLEQYAGLPTTVHIASEYRYYPPLGDEGTLVIVISQSGETADSLAALRYAKEHGRHTLGIVNAVETTIAREADKRIYTYAGPEIAVATTKGYCTQASVLYAIAAAAGLSRGVIDAKAAKELLRDISEEVPAVLETMLGKEAQFCRIAKALADHEHVFYIGRGLDYAMSMEGALKLKEISYIHCEAYAAGELKHGTISLIEPGTPVIALATDPALFEKTESNLREVGSRGAQVTLICPEGVEVPEESAGEIIRLPECSAPARLFASMLAVQMIAYEAASFRGCDIDRPRNLAKSVTVE